MAALAHLFPVLGDLEQQVEVEAGVEAALLEGGGYHLDRGMRVAERQRRMGGVGDGRARLGCLDDVGRSHAADVVAVQVDGQADLLAQRRADALGAVRGEHARHVLDADGVRAEVLPLLRVLDVAVERVHRAHRVGDASLEMGPGLLDGLGAIHDVADVVERVEDAEHVHAIAMRGLEEPRHDVLRVMVVSHEVLTTGEHGERCLGAMLLDGAQALPRVLIQKAQACVERRTAPSLERPIADLVHLVQDGQHIAGLHPSRPQRLMRVAQGGVHDMERSHICLPPLSRFASYGHGRALRTGNSPRVANQPSRFG